MNGKYMYFALSALLGVLCALVTFYPFFLLMIFYMYLLYQYKRFSKEQIALLVVVFTLSLLIGMREERMNHSLIPESTTAFILESMENPKIDGDLLQVEVKEKFHNENLLIRYKLKSENEKINLQNKSFFSRVCRVSGSLKKPAMAKNPNGFDYRNYLSNKRIHWILETNENPLQHCTSIPPSLLVMVKQLRFTGTRYLTDHFPIEIASLSAALIFGDRSLLNPDLLGNYQRTGIVHLLAISGLHVSLLIGVVFYLGLRVGITRQWMRNVLLVAIPVYVILTGSSPSVIRAGLMIFLVLLTTKWKNRLKLLPIDAICLAFIIFLFIDPLVIFDVGFQLSFSVSMAIILSAGLIFSIYQHSLLRMLVTSVISQLAAFPFLLYHYFELSLVGIIANMLYIPLFSFVYLPGVYFLFVVQLLFSNTPIILVNSFLKIISFFNGVIDYAANIPFGSFIAGRPNLILLIVEIIIIFAVFCNWEEITSSKGKRHLILLSILLFSLQMELNRFNPYGEVTMIDVGQGDSILIQLPFHKGTILIDTGGTMQYHVEEWRQRANPFEVGKDVVVPFLKGKGVTKIDKLILTHGDIDHIGGSFSILEELKVKQILIPSVIAPSETELDIIKIAKKKGIPVIKVAAGDHWNIDEFEFFILSPERNFAGERNSGSIAFVSSLGGRNWFFGGDLDQEGEEKIIKRYPHITIDVLKAGHHGSKTSSAELFIHQVKPKTVLISAGEKNRFGHPHQEVLERLKKVNATIYRTDLQGAITYRFYKQKGTFSTFLP
ncbi:DNA internalization-related competence protein ComEC/Rec2 [Neobacillus drentensis]|uniref:DNA internalization-related competence protein ComEC/Rec2 n=1 Tax=Neobacillus drentensis TaxID=220684 RepID=UPI002FFDF03D